MRKRRLLALLLAAVLLLTACAEQKALSDRVGDAAGKTEATKPLQPAPSPSPDALRQEMAGTGQLFAVAYFGYHDTIDSEIPVDPITVVREQAPKLCRKHPFLTEIPADRTVGERGDLFCIVPLDPNATVSVTRGHWDETLEAYIYAENIYFSESGEPILLFCNGFGWEPDTQVYISGPSGDLMWYPQLDDAQCAMPIHSDSRDALFLDFSPYREMMTKRYRDMEGEWAPPTEEQLRGTTWRWEGWRKDGREVSYSVTFGEDTLCVQWSDGIDPEAHSYRDAPWTLTSEEGFGVLSIDFGQMAGVLRYDLMYDEGADVMYFGMDVLQEEMPIGWEPMYRFLRPPVAPEPVELLGLWELAWTEVEGDRNEAAPGICTIEIRMSASSGLLMSYTSREFPNTDFENEPLTFDERTMYSGCGNDAWVADLAYVGPWDTTYAFTLTADDILIKQNRYLLDGAPSVSYEYFRRIWE